MKQILKQLIPWSLQQRLRRRQHFLSPERRILADSEEFKAQIKEIEKIAQEPILFAGRMKSGNTWLRFLIYNYFNICNSDASETLTYHQLNQLQHDELGDAKPIKGSSGSFPYLLRTHMGYCAEMKLFKKGIYVYRNPLDTLVSAFHFDKKHTERNTNFGEDIDAYVLYNMILWEVHVFEYRQQQRFHAVSYEALQQNPEKELQHIIEYLGYTYHSESGKKSVDLSSFTNIKQMGKNVGQEYGNGGAAFKGEFTRKGKVGAYRDELKPETIDKATHFLHKYGVGTVDYLF